MPQGDFVEQQRGLGFYWLSDAHDRAESHSKGLTLFGSPVYEVDADFKEGKLSGLTVSIYNRGDAGEIGKEQWQALGGKCAQGLTTLTKAQPVIQGQEAGDAVKAQAALWPTPASNFLLEYSFTREVKTRGIPFRGEFMRLRVTPREKPKSLMAAALASATQQAPFNGRAHVKKDANGDVRIDTVPMVDQGQKGYCVVATAERVMRYYGVGVDEHELAELANSSASQGTSNAAMFASLKKLSERLRVKIRNVDNMEMNVQQILALISTYTRVARREHAALIPDQGQMLNIQRIYSSMKPDILKEIRTRNKSEVDRFQREIQDHIDEGIPVLWSVILGIIHEDKAPQGIGGHMRLIIGYNAGTNEILYSDSWGPGHELKRMAAGDAWTMTTSLNVIEPLD